MSNYLIETELLTEASKPNDIESLIGISGYKYTKETQRVNRHRSFVQARYYAKAIGSCWQCKPEIDDLKSGLDC